MTEYLLPFQPSIGQATNTRLDSAAKHIQQCRVSTDDMLRYVGDVEELTRQKYRYCIHKDELVVGIGRPWDPTTVVKRTSNQAYPRVVSNLGCLGDTEAGKVATNMIRYMNHYARSIDEKQRILHFFRQDQYVPAIIGGIFAPNADCFRQKPGAGNRMGTSDFLDVLCDFVPVGYSNTIGYAHSNTGDTMTSVMIGGLRTVQNGDFEVFPGDILQFYWPFEKDDFMPDGRRKPYVDIWAGATPGNVDPSYAAGGAQWTLPTDARIRQANFSLQYSAKQSVVKLVARIKPYFRDDDNPRLGDWIRVFAVAISSARPHEQLDIKISKQSV